MKYDALLVLECFQLPAQEDMEDALLGKVLDGFIFDDTKLEGNHPFPQCHYIYTSNVQQIVVENGQTYIITRNTTYLLIGCATGHNAANRVYTKRKDELRGPVSLTGDPVNQ